MNGLEAVLLGLLVISVLTGLTTEAVKLYLTEHGKTYRANTLAGGISLVLSLAIGIGYTVVSNIAFNAQIVVYLVALTFMSWLCAMVGYDKVMQAISQFKTSEKEG